MGDWLGVPAVFVAWSFALNLPSIGMTLNP